MRKQLALLGFLVFVVRAEMQAGLTPEDGSTVHSMMIANAEITQLTSTADIYVTNEANRLASEAATSARYESARAGFHGQPPVTNFSNQVSAQNPDSRPRLLITTDIGGDADDQQSLIRLLLYANVFRIEGLLATASGTPGELGVSVVKPELIEETVRAYGAVHSNLIQHQADYPPMEYLLSIIKRGNPMRGLTYIGAGNDTEGSNWIIEVADRPDPQPVNIAMWGGNTDLAQALWKVKNTRSAEAYRTFVSRLRIYDIADQDKIQSWMMKQFPGLNYILSKWPTGDSRLNAVFRGMYLGGDESLTSGEWIRSNVKENHGPLGALYPMKTTTTPNPYGVMKEGDTPSWLYFLPNGLSDPEKPTYGGWGGRFAMNSTYYADAPDQVEGINSFPATVWRWRPHFQNDFQARMDWCVKPFAGANHAPVAAFRTDTSRDVVYQTVTAGEEIVLSAQGSRDPDGNLLTYQWTQYSEPGTIPVPVPISNPTSAEARFTAPEVSESATLHIILTVRDNGTPNLHSYRRVVFTVLPKTFGIASFTLVNAETGQDIKVLQDNDVLPLSTFGQIPLSIRANTFPAQIYQVQFALTGPLAYSRREGSLPYALFGDNSKGTYYGKLLPAGRYTLTATPYTREQTGPPATVHFDLAPNGTLATMLRQDQNFSVFTTALKQVGYLSIVDGLGPMTLFAPTNPAFSALLTSLGWKDVREIPVTQLKEIVRYHLIAGKELRIAQFSDGQRIQTRQYSYVAISLNGTQVKVNEATVIMPDLLGSNGVMHGIDQVLLPPSVVLTGSSLRVSASPNPGASSVSIQVAEPSHRHMEVAITDQYGNPVARHSVNTSGAPTATYEVDMSTLHPGVYMVQTQLGEERQTIRVIR